MSPLGRRPARPKFATPPADLVSALASLRNTDVVSSGLTTTSTGEWAALVQYRQGAKVPMPEVERHFAGFPIVYEASPQEAPVARPAYPGMGE